MTLEIKKYGDSVLRKKSDEVKEITPEIKELIFNMKETMERNQAVGLAAPQIGILRRVIVVKTENGTAGFINPKIIKKTKEFQIQEEGCLCLLGLFLKIKRARGVEVGALDEAGQKVQIKADALLARIFQHEVDHLDGKLIINRIPFWQKWKLRKQLKERIFYPRA